MLRIYPRRLRHDDLLRSHDRPVPACSRYASGWGGSSRFFVMARRVVSACMRRGPPSAPAARPRAQRPPGSAPPPRRASVATLAPRTGRRVPILQRDQRGEFERLTEVDDADLPNGHLGAPSGRRAQSPGGTAPWRCLARVRRCLSGDGRPGQLKRRPGQLNTGRRRGRDRASRRSGRAL